jgi:hypothetical protein
MSFLSSFPLKFFDYTSVQLCDFGEVWFVMH